MTYIETIQESQAAKLLLVTIVSVFGYYLYSKIKMENFKRIYMSTDNNDKIELNILECERDTRRFTHIILVGLVFFMIAPGIYFNGHISNDAILHAGISTITLLFIWYDNKKRDTQHLEIIKMMTYASRRDSIQKNIESVADNLLNRRKTDVESGIRFYTGGGMPTKNYDGCITLWDLEYKNKSGDGKKGLSYEFKIRFLVFPNGAMSKFHIHDAPSGQPTMLIPPAVMDLIENSEKLQLELLLSRTNKTYGEFAERGSDSIWHMQPEMFYVVCNALASIQIITDAELEECRRAIHDHRSKE